MAPTAMTTSVRLLRRHALAVQQARGHDHQAGRGVQPGRRRHFLRHLLAGEIAGITGILRRAFAGPQRGWRLAFLGGMVVAALGWLLTLTPYLLVITIIGMIAAMNAPMMGMVEIPPPAPVPAHILKPWAAKVEEVIKAFETEGKLPRGLVAEIRARR